MEANSEIVTAPLDPLDREQIKALRKVRNKLKRQQKRAEKNFSKPPESSPEMIDQKQHNVSIVSREFYDRINNGSMETTFPSRSKRRSDLVIDISKPTAPQHLPQDGKLSAVPVTIIANRLDKSQPILLKGKHSENKKCKKESTLKKSINQHRQSNPVDPVASQESYNYVNNIITDTLEQLACRFIGEVVTLQEKYYQKDPKKAVIKRRYVVGFHQLKKYLIVKKIQIFFIATNIKVVENDPLDNLIKEVIQLAEENNIKYAFVLQRRKLGHLTLKHLPISCAGILNYDGANETFKLLVDELQQCKLKFSEILGKKEDPMDHVYGNLLQKLQDELKL